MNRLDYVVLIATILAIPLYGLWRTRGRETLGHYLKGDQSIRWGTIGLSVLATQAGPARNGAPRTPVPHDPSRAE